MWPPTALGRGKTSMEDKFAAWMHSIWLEADVGPLSLVLENTIAITPDMGTESTLPDIMAMKVAEMLPGL